MSNNTWWMSPQTLEKYNQILNGLNESYKEHRRLITKLHKKTITESELKDLHKIIQIVNKLEKHRKQILDQNPLNVKNVLKALKAQNK